MLLDRAGIKSEGPRLTVVELPRVVEVTEAPSSEGGHGPEAPAARCYICSSTFRQTFWTRQVLRRMLVATEHREAPRRPLEVI